MTARGKLNEAQDFLNEMREIYDESKLRDQENQNKFKHRLSAFLSAMRSVPDHMLEDHNKKFDLKIPSGVKLYPETFRKAAESRKSTKALAFYEWWCSKMNELRKGELGFLLDMRDVSIHRCEVGPNRAKVEITCAPSVRWEVRIHDEKGKLVAAQSSQQPPPPKESKVRIDWFFKEHDKEPVISVCEKYFGVMQRFIEAAEKRNG